MPINSVIYGDKAYNDYKYKDRLIQERQIHLMPIRKKNSKRKGGGFFAKIRRRKRKIIETAFSCMEKLMPRSIHAVAKAGFELKIMLFVLAYAFNKVTCHNLGYKNPPAILCLVFFPTLLFLLIL